MAQIIPPSLVLIVLADQLGRSVGDMYMGALIPGLVLTGLYMLYILYVDRPAEFDAGAAAGGAHARRGVTSLLVALAVRRHLLWRARLLSPTQGANADILGATVGIIVIYIVAIADKRSTSA